MVEGKAQEDNNEYMFINVEMISVKPPLIVGGEGLVELCDDQSYYYSLTKLEVTNPLEVNGISEPVTGYAWIDQQWGNVMDEDFNPSGLSIEYEWFSIKLNDFSEILVGDSLRRDTSEKVQSFSDKINILNIDGALEILKDYEITQLDFWIDDLTGRNYSSKWRLTENTKPNDLIITQNIDNQIM